MTTFLLKSALELAYLGLKVLPLHTVDSNGHCSCGCRKANCGSRGKHPRIRDWQHLASDDEDTICAWWEQWPLANVGVQWGPRSNAIDIEFDNEEGRASADKYLGGIVTPSYQSGRSIHRIFRYVDALVGFGATKKGEKVEHLEFRIGADDRGAQSVAPPSRHYSGREYCWLRGLHIAEVEIAPPPPALVELILKSRDAKAGAGRSKAPPAIAEKIPCGQRYTALLSLAGTLRRRGLVAEEIAPTLRAVNERRCEYVRDDEIDVEELARSICRYEPGDPILAKPDALATSVRDAASSHLPAAIRRARKHAIEHRLKQTVGLRS